MQQRKGKNDRNALFFITMKSGGNLTRLCTIFGTKNATVDPERFAIADGKAGRLSVEKPPLIVSEPPFSEGDCAGARSAGSGRQAENKAIKTRKTQNKRSFLLLLLQVVVVLPLMESRS